MSASDKVVSVELAKRMQHWGRVRRVPERFHTPLLVLAGTIFLVGTVLAYRTLDVALSDMRLSFLLIVLVAGTPLTVFVNAAELRVIANAGHTTFSWLHATRTVVLATAANMLPIPGAAVVRTHALVANGVAMSVAVRLIMSAAIVWVGISAVVAGLAAATLLPGAALVFAFGGVVAVGVGVLAFASRPRLTVTLLGVELATSLVHAFRLWLVLLALGVDVDLREPIVLSAAAPLAAAAGVFPSGLGLAEGLSAAIAATIGLGAAIGFVATAVMRVVGLAGTAVVALLMGVFHGLTDRVVAPLDSDEHGF